MQRYSVLAESRKGHPKWARNEARDSSQLDLTDGLPGASGTEPTENKGQQQGCAVQVEIQARCSPFPPHAFLRTRKERVEIFGIPSQLTGGDRGRRRTSRSNSIAILDTTYALCHSLIHAHTYSLSRNAGSALG